MSRVRHLPSVAGQDAAADGFHRNGLLPAVEPVESPAFYREGKAYRPGI
ncbi:hypothetical protein ABZ864_47910 [Streptomyces sp. NPDC047082]